MILPLQVLAAEPPTPGPGVSTPPVEHITTDPLLPQKYRTVKAGVYKCSVVIKVSKEGRATDVLPVDCEEETLWALTTAILQWEFDPATRDGVAVDGELPFTNEFTVTTLLPRANVVGFVGVAASAGGAGLMGVEGRIHLGERVSFSGGVDFDQDTIISTLEERWAPVFRGDFTLSSRRQRYERRGVYGMTVGAYADTWGGSGTYFGFRGEVMTPVPGLSIGGDAGVATVWGKSRAYEDLGVWARGGSFPFLPWLRVSVLWYAPFPRDHFVVVPRPDDPVVYEAPIPEPEPIADEDGLPFPGIPSLHWSEIEPSFGENTPTGPGFDLYPPGSYDCNVRAAVSPEGLPVRIRVERCPAAGEADAAANVQRWEWPPRPGEEVVQSVFPAPIFVHHDDAILLDVQSVLLLTDKATSPLPVTADKPQVWARVARTPDWGATRPTRNCFVDIDISAAGEMLGYRWVAGDVEVQARVFEALKAWKFYPVAVEGELTATRVRLAMCGSGLPTR